MASRVITTVAGTGFKIIGNLFKGAGSLLTKAGRRKRDAPNSSTSATRSHRPDTPTH